MLIIVLGGIRVKDNNNIYYMILFVVGLIILPLIGNGTFLLIYISLITVVGIYLKKQYIKESIMQVVSHRQKIKNLEYYHLTDLDKSEDRRERIANVSLLTNISFIGYIVGIILVSTLVTASNILFGKSSVISIFYFIILILLIFLFLWVVCSAAAFNYPTIFYCCIPLISLITFSIFEYQILDKANYLKLLIYLFIVAIIDITFSLALPVHVIRKVNSKVVIFTAFLTVITTIFVQSTSVITEILLKNENILFTKKMIENDPSFPNELKRILANDDIIKLINHFIVKEFTSEFNGIFSFAISGITLSFLIGGIFISLRISRAKADAKKILYDQIFKDKAASYENLVRCAYLGGDEYELIILSNNEWIEIIKKHEQVSIHI